MSQQQFFFAGESPGTPNIEFTAGNDSVKVGPNPATFTINIVGNNAQGVNVTGNAGTFTETITVQNSTAAATSGAALKGVSSYNSADFTDVNGFVSLLGSISGTVTTNGLETKTVATIPTTANSTTTFEARVSGYATPIGAGVNSGIGGTITAAFITGGVSTSAINTPDVFIQTFLSPTATFTATGSGTNIIITVTGDALFDINWKCNVNTTEVS